MTNPDPRPPRRIRDPELLRTLHILWRGTCALEEADVGDCYEGRYSLHHIHPHPRDDTQPNLAMLCGDGVLGHHGDITGHVRVTCLAFSRYLIAERLDTMTYLGQKLGGVNAVKEWLNSQLHASL